MDAIYICLVSRIDTKCLQKQFIADYTGRLKFNACSSNLLAKSPRGQIESC